MATTHRRDLGSGAVASGARRRDDVGWVTFAALALGFAGIFCIVDGIIAVTKSRFFVGDAVYVFSDLNTWGWIVLGLGIAEVIAVWRVLRGSELARWFGVAVAGINALGQLMFVQAYPFWALSVFALDALVIYALVAHGGSRLRSGA
jgi:hypothetical protein